MHFFGAICSQKMVLRLINYAQIPPYKAQNQQDININEKI